MKLRPLQDRILVQRVKEEGKTKGGIIIPDTAKEKPIEGMVIAAGNGKLNEEGKRIALEVKKGLIPSITFAIALEGSLEGNHFLNQAETTMVALLDRRNAKRNGCD